MTPEELATLRRGWFHTVRGPSPSIISIVWDDTKMLADLEAFAARVREAALLEAAKASESLDSFGGGGPR